VRDLVLIHGLGSDHRYWDELIPELTGDFDVLALDLPGHGSGAKRLTAQEAHPRALAAAVADQLVDRGIDQPHVVGLSLGGWVALELAATGRCASVVALSPAGLWAEGTRVHRERQGLLLGPVIRMLGPTLPSLTRISWVKKVGLAKNVAAPQRVSDEAFLAAAHAIGKSRGYSACEEAVVTDRFREGTRIRVPTTVAYGDDDKVFPAPTYQDPSELPAQARFEVVADCGHAMTWDQPETCLGLIRDTTSS
jgi:Predicted hydrolases or acyltransferases (alpha/beta hydrolase superfamily)